jgi:3-beta hydroxysteroid dehydrogenase/isomerase family
VFHVAADISVWSRHDERQTRVNVAGARNMVEAALARGIGRFVHTSIWNVYGLEQGVISERSPQLGAISWINYNRSKFPAEEAVRAGIARGRLPARAAITPAAGIQAAAKAVLADFRPAKNHPSPAAHRGAQFCNQPKQKGRPGATARRRTPLGGRRSGAAPRAVSLFATVFSTCSIGVRATP